MIMMVKKKTMTIMKNKIIIIIFASLLICGCSKNEVKDTVNEIIDNIYEEVENNNNTESDYIVTFDNIKGITYEEYNKNIVDYTGLDYLLNKSDELILNNKYSNKIDAANYYVEETYQNYINAYGSEEKLISNIKSVGYKDQETFKYNLYLSYLRDVAILDYARTLVKESDIKKYKLDGSYEDKKDALAYEMIDKDKNIYKKALIKLRKEYNMKIYDKDLEKEYNNYINS